MARVIVSGIQPSGVPHLGNYLGAVVNWVGIQRAAAPGTPLYYFLADLHCLTVPYDAANLSTRCRCDNSFLYNFGYRSNDVQSGAIEAERFGICRIVAHELVPALAHIILDYIL